MPPATNLRTDSFMPPFLDVPSEPGPPGSWQARAYHAARACDMHLSELERKNQYISKLERRIRWYQAQIARLKDAQTHDANDYSESVRSAAVGGAGAADCAATRPPYPPARAGAPLDAARDHPPQQTTGDDIMLWILKPTTDLQGRPRVGIFNIDGLLIDLYWPEQEAAALRVINNYNATLLLARQLEKAGLFAAAA